MVCLVLLVACALPVPVRVATWVIDGIVIAATEKSIADHGISAIASKDCAMWRTVAGREACVDVDDKADTLVAKNDEPSAKESPRSFAADGDVEDLATFETAAGEDEVVTSSGPTRRVVIWLTDWEGRESDPTDVTPLVTAALENPGADNPRIGALHKTWSPDPTVAEIDPTVVLAGVADVPLKRHGENDARRTQWLPDATVAEIDPTIVLAAAADVPLKRRGEREEFVRAWSNALDLQAVDPTASWVEKARAMSKEFVEPRPRLDGVETSPVQATELKAKRPTAKKSKALKAEGGLYFVVGSYQVLTNARSMASKHAVLEPSVVTARLDGVRVFRVVVGPFTQRERLVGHRRVKEAGIYDAWIIQLDPEQWRLAQIDNTTPGEVASTATVSDISR